VGTPTPTATQPKKGKIGEKFLANAAVAKSSDDLSTPKQRPASSSVGAKTASLSHKLGDHSGEDAKSPGGAAATPTTPARTPGKLKFNNSALEATLKAGNDDHEGRGRSSTTAPGGGIPKASGKINALGGGLANLLARGPGEKVRRSSGAAGDFSPMAMLAAEEHAKRTGNAFPADGDNATGNTLLYSPSGYWSVYTCSI
jgi:hypothetical protein